MLPPIAALALLATAANAAPAEVRLHQPQRVGRITVTPLAVVEDSRCPMNARCVWAGGARVRVAIRDERTRLIRVLTLGEPAASGIVLDSLTPERMAGTSGRQQPYRFHFSAIKPD